MDNFIKILVWVHAGFGGIALLSGFFAMIFKKGAKNHLITGKIYFISMTFVCATAVIVAAYRPIPFLLFIATFSYYFVITGYRSLYHKNIQPDQKIPTLDLLIAVVAGLFNVGLIIWAALNMNTNQQISIVAIVFGVLGLRFVYKNISKFKSKNREKPQWLFEHLTGMIGAYIATVTAFLVVNFSFIPPIILWIGPTIIGIPMIFYFIKTIKTKLKDNTISEIIETKI